MRPPDGAAASSSWREITRQLRQINARALLESVRGGRGKEEKGRMQAELGGKEWTAQARTKGYAG